VLLLGDGPLKGNILALLQETGVDYTYPGYASQQQLPQYYASARLFLFPTAYDAWGVVAQEALAAGTPVLVTPYAGCSDELVIQQENGYILPLEAPLWAEQCAVLLQDALAWKHFSQKAKERASQFSHERAANALLEACNHASNQ
jgi:glycosyltransferase involved in cell wall biosynthesis